MAYGGFKDLTRRTASDKKLRDKGFNVAKNPKYDGYQRDLGSMVYKFAVKNKNMPNEEMAEELHKPTIRKFEKRKVYTSFTDNIWGADLADM